MVSKTNELYAEVIEALPPIERLRLASLVIRNYLQHNNIIGSEIIGNEPLVPDHSIEVSVLETIAEIIENYCLNRAMDEAAQTPLLDQVAALQFLEQDSDEG